MAALQPVTRVPSPAIGRAGAPEITTHQICAYWSPFRLCTSSCLQVNYVTQQHEDAVNYELNDPIEVGGLSSAGRTGGRHILAVHARKMAAEQHGHSTGQSHYWWQCVYYGQAVREPGPTCQTSPCNAEHYHSNKTIKDGGVAPWKDKRIKTRPKSLE